MVYTAQEYAAYIGILVVIVFLLDRFLFKRVVIDRRFITLITPYMIVGVSIRLLADLNVYPKSHLWSITPGVYVLTILIAIFFLAIGLLLNKAKGVAYWKVPFFAGCGIAAYLLYELSLRMTHPERILPPVAFAFLVTAAIYFVSRIIKRGIFQRPENLAIVYAHMMDAFASSIALNTYGFEGEHPVPRYLISLAGGNAYIMIPLKLIVVLAVVYTIEKWYLEETEKQRSGDKSGHDSLVKTRNIYMIIKIIIFIIGVGPGLRDVLLPSLS